MSLESIMPSRPKAKVLNRSNNYQKKLSNHLLSIDGVGKIQVTGLPLEAVYLEIDHDALVRMGLPLEQVLGAIATQTGVASEASIMVEGRRAGLSLESHFSSHSRSRVDQAGTSRGHRNFNPG